MKRTLPNKDDDHAGEPVKLTEAPCPMRSAGTIGDGVVDLSVSWLVTADLTAVDALARLQLAATQRAHRLQLHGADQELADLLEFVGLSDIVHLCPNCGSSMRRGVPPSNGT